MKLFWFSNIDGHEWFVFQAKDEQQAWELLRQENPGFVSQAVADATEEGKIDRHLIMELDSVTDLSAGRPGKVAWILPLEVTFSIRKEPQSRAGGGYTSQEAPTT
jgi:hypothetical protein